MPPEPLLSYSDYFVSINGIIVEAGVAAIKEKSNEVAQAVDSLYYDFFGELYREVGGGTTQTPSRFLGNIGDAGAWKPLSESWRDRKLKVADQDPSLFYKGLTDALNKSKRRVVRKGKKSGRNVGPSRRNKKSFEKFLGEVASNSRVNVKRFFGEITIDYAIAARGRKTPIDISQVNNVITQIGAITAHEGSKRLPNYNNVALRANITMFPALKAAKEFSEWYVVNILARQDKTGAKQWLKINSRFGAKGSERPIRAMVTPLISWYATTGLINILKRFY